MGFGDDIITTAIVRRAYQRVKTPLVVGDGLTVVWSEVFENNPKIAREPYKGCYWVKSVQGNRPYIDYSRSTPSRTVYKKFDLEPGEIYLTSDEKNHQPGVYIEPNVKGTYGGNKDWGFERWQEVVRRTPHIPWVQGQGRKLDGARQVDTKTFREALGLLDAAYFYVGTDGGLHHAAAALGKRAVVVWGGLVGPDVLGYSTHANLHSGAKSCGSHEACPHCRKALDAITVEMVVRQVESDFQRIRGVEPLAA